MIYTSGKEGGTGDGTAVTYRSQIVCARPPWLAQEYNSPYNALMPRDSGYSFMDWLMEQQPVPSLGNLRMDGFGMPPMMGGFGGMGGIPMGGSPFGVPMDGWTFTKYMEFLAEQNRRQMERRNGSGPRTPEE